MQTEIAVPDTREIEKSATQLEEAVNALEIVDDTTFLQAQELLIQINTSIKKAEPELDKPRASAYEHYQSMKKWMDDILDPFRRAKKTIGAKIGDWDYKVQEKRRKEIEAAEAKARKLAEEQRQRDIEAAKKAKDKDTLAALKVAPIIVNPVAPKTQEPTKAEGVSIRYEWKLEMIFNPTLLPREFLMADEKKIKERIKSLGQAHGIPGVKAIRVPITSGRV